MRSDELRKPAYTSGPWRIGYGGMDGDTTATITSPFVEYPICQLEPLGYVQANARLIAAAPELLEAARKLMFHLTGIGVFPNAVVEMQAAIAKAEGKV
jgi:hypothetical protein